MGRYTGSSDTLVLTNALFSAGSFADLSTLYLLWENAKVVTNGKLGAIACPPQLIVTLSPNHTLHLLHYEADQLCVWKPGGHQLELQIRYTCVSTEGPAYKEHFGSKKTQLLLLAGVSIIQQENGISPGSSSGTLRQQALLEEMPLSQPWIR